MSSERTRGVLLMLGAAACFSTGGLFVRLLPGLAPVELVFWRSLFSGLFIFAVLVHWHRARLPARLRAGGLPAAVSAVFLAATFFFFLFAVSHTTVANTAVLMSTGPLFLALAARLFLAERTRRGTWFAILAALAGMALMFSEGLAGGRLAGNLYALAIPISFTANYIVLRRAAARTDPTVAALFAAAIALAAAAPFVPRFAIAARDLALLACLGVVQVGLGLVLMTRAYHRLSAGELGLIGLVEPVLAPLWVWLAIGEAPGGTAAAGGALVLAAVAANQALLVREAARASPSSAAPPDRGAPAPPPPGDSARRSGS